MAKVKKETLFVRGVVVSNKKWLAKEAKKAKVTVAVLLNGILAGERKRSVGNEKQL